MLARIQRNSARYGTWISIFQTDTIHVIEPPKVNSYGANRILVNVTRLDDGQVKRLAAKVASWSRLPGDRVLRDMRESGSVSISADDLDMVEEAGVLF